MPTSGNASAMAAVTRSSTSSIGAPPSRVMAAWLAAPGWSDNACTVSIGAYSTAKSAKSPPRSSTMKNRSGEIALPTTCISRSPLMRTVPVGGRS